MITFLPPVIIWCITITFLSSAIVSHMSASPLYMIWALCHALLIQVLIPRQAVITLSPGGVQAMQALIPKQAVLSPSQEGVQAVQVLFPMTGSVCPPSQEWVQAVQMLIPRQAAITLSPGGVQAMQVLIPRQVGSNNPQPRSACNAATHSQAAIDWLEVSQTID